MPVTIKWRPCVIVFAICLGTLCGGRTATAAYLQLAPPGRSVPPIDSKGIRKAQARFAYRLIAHLARTSKAGTNVIVSPAGVASILSILDLGASVRMRSAIQQTLSLPRRTGVVEAIDLARMRDASSLLIDRSEEPGPLAFANSLIFSPSARPRRNALLWLAASGADVEVESLSSRKTLTQINNWVRDRTRGRIPVVLNEPPRNANLVAINALYFADHWRVPFDPTATRIEPFRRTKADVIKVQMMHLNSGQYQFRTDKRFVAVKLPYATSGYSMVVITTRGEPETARRFEPVASWLSGNGFYSQPGELALPKFSLSDRRSLLSALDAMGLRRGRTSIGAFRKLAEQPLQISKILQRTQIQVDEKGTVAAAATIVETMRSMAHGFVKMVADKPFMFALLDRTSGLILLAGYVSNPTIMSNAAVKGR